MGGVTLSICIPTYNRSKFLDYLLTNIGAQTYPFPIEIVISDNASTDETPDVVAKHQAAGLPIVSFRQARNKGAMANVYSVYHRARGEFAVYVGDDDLLIPEAVIETVEFLKANAAVLAAYAPWELYDDVAKVTGGQFYQVEKDIVFGRGQEIELFQYIIQRHVFPEIVIFRAAALRSVISEGIFCFQQFLEFGRIFQRGSVAFLARPFYRSVVNSQFRRNEDQLGVQQVMTQWDQYRGGLEHLVYTLLKTSGLRLDATGEAAVRTLIDRFVDARMQVAQRMWLARQDFVRAYQILCRRKCFDPAGVAADATAIGHLQQFVGLQTIAEMANKVAGIERIVLGDFADTALADVLRRCGLEAQISVDLHDDAFTAGQRANALVLLGEERSRSRFAALGYQPGLIFSTEDLLAIV